MPESRPRGRSTRFVAGLAALVTAFSIAAAVQPAKADPPPNPSDQQINSAAAQKAALATQVGQLGGQVVQMQSQLQQLQAQQEMAEQRLAYALSLLQEAKDAATAARANVARAQGRVDAAQRAFIGYMQASYMSGDVGGTTGALLTATDPNALLARSTLQSYQSTEQLTAIGELQRATVAKSNADAGARKAVQDQAKATAVAKQAEQDAAASVAAAQEQELALQASLAASQTKLQAAQLQLATLNNQRAQYVAWQQEQARIAAAKAAAARAAAAAAEAAARKHSGDGGGGNSGPPPPPTGGNWTAARGAAAVSRARQYLGWPYAWAGGNASGPTYGVCAGGAAHNDCHIIGFDCSGLSLYGWAPYEYLPHFAMAQYSVAGRYHPSFNALMPGDLVFWSSNGSVSGIHHVAIYIGGGNVIQAPQSGSVIQITGLYNVTWGLFGATRPLT